MGAPPPFDRMKADWFKGHYDYWRSRGAERPSLESLASSTGLHVNTVASLRRRHERADPEVRARREALARLKILR